MYNWGEPERPPRTIYLNVSYVFPYLPCPRALIHWTVQYFTTGPHPTSYYNTASPEEAGHASQLHHMFAYFLAFQYVVYSCDT